MSLLNAHVYSERAVILLTQVMDSCCAYHRLLRVLILVRYTMSEGINRLGIMDRETLGLRI